MIFSFAYNNRVPSSQIAIWWPVEHAYKVYEGLNWMNTSELIYDWNQALSADFVPCGPVLLNDAH